MNSTPTHIPVLLDECVELFAPALVAADAVAVDGTLGLGGHSEALLERFPHLTVIGIDRDASALALAGERLSRFGSRFVGVHTTYDRIADALARAGRRAAHGILLDLGISSMQIDVAERGFAYAVDAPLDSRMDVSDTLTAADVLNGYSEAELTHIFREYGEEKLAARYARAIVAARQSSPIVRSGELVDILQAATPYALRNVGHPAKRVFQALRIEVNRELDILRDALAAALDALVPGGRLAVLSYHSLEDRIVKSAFAAATTSTAPVGVPVIPVAYRPRFRLVFGGARTASPDEVIRNSRAASVRFRAIERLEEAA